MASKKKQPPAETAEPSVLDLAHALMNPVAPEKPKRKGTVGTGNFKKKVKSNGLAVHPSQVKEIAAEDRKRGVAVEYDRRGQPVFDNSSHFRRYCKAYGLRHMGYT